MKDKKIIYTLITIVAIFILLSSVVVYQFVNLKEEKEVEEKEKFVLDDRINPLNNQGLILEVLRIRHRGLLEKLVERGTGWKNKPNFYFISKIDDTEYISKDVVAAGAESEILFNCWDTIGKENKIMEDTQEGQEESIVKITIVERVASGFLGRKSQDIIREEITVVYDYRTGRWHGDDGFMDSDGYGHYLGKYFEVWFNIYQTDYDGDGIPYWVEVNVLGTNPTIDDSKLDPDGDGIPTAWEWKWGYDPFTWDDHKNLDPDVDGLSNIEEYQMRKYFANPYQRDVYIESDGMEKGGIFDPAHVFYEESEQVLIERYSQHGINIYIDSGWPDGPVNGGGELLPHVETISQDSGMILQFYRHNFADERKGIFRYMLTGHNTGFCHPSVSNKYDTLAIDNSLIKLLKRGAFTERTKRIVLAAAAMHELGHSMGLGSWSFAGIDNRNYYASTRTEARKNYEDTYGADYLSIMSYKYIFDKKLLDYSDGSNGAPYDQDDWSKLYLPTFKIDAEVIEGPNYAFLENFEDKVAAVQDKEPLPMLEGWKADGNITNKFVSSNSLETTIYKGDCEYLVFIKVDDKSNIVSGERNVRVYVKPNVKPVFSTWSLCYEGEYNPSSDSFEFYSGEKLVDDILSIIK